MSNAKIIYDQIIDSGYINSHLIGKSFEDTWFDCKQKANANNGKLEDGDKSNFAKALSGFANTSGGVLIFGLDARKVNGVDVIQSFCPIKELKLFESELREAESRIVERAISGLQYQKIYTDLAKDEGIIKIYIPEGNNPPYRSVVDKRFYIRAGGNFVSIDLPQIESLVLKNIKPDLDLNVYLTRNSEIVQGANNICLNFQVTNIGKSLAKYVLFQLRFSEEIIHLFKINSVHNSYQKSENSLIEDRVAYGWRFESVIHSNDFINPPLFNLVYDLSGGPMRGIPLSFEISIYAENMPMKTYVVDIDYRKFWFSIRGSTRLSLVKKEGRFVLE